MQIREVLVRWYKSFNYDYELKALPRAAKHAWQDTDDGWLPHVRIHLEDDITAVVGANESGKSHLLDVIQIVLNGRELSKEDFCRYSTLFSVEKGQRLFPEVGAVFSLSERDVGVVEALGIPRQANGSLLLLRPDSSAIDVVNSEDQRVRLNATQEEGLWQILPYAFELNTHVGLPDSVSIAALAGTSTRVASRKKRSELMEALSAAGAADEIPKAAALFSLLIRDDRIESDQDQLGRLLLTKVAQIETSAFRDLQRAIADEHEGLVNALIQEMNKSIARHLNVSKWWSQDEDFQLRVSPREHELVFTIRDRTGTDYSFSERSRGLTYFLSYYVQLRSHDRHDSRPEILLMDEPDAYLSALGQHDLLRVLENHAHPEDSDRSDQVVYVTHSPFLINRNAGHRVRVVDKGSRDEGTRLVKDVTRNHYEPLRTALGMFAAETAFIGGDNLFVEGISDQVLLAGMNGRLRRAGAPPSQCLDLNQVTLVPGGTNVPYMLYLARGRDEHKPACAVLLDSDRAGQQARAQILKGGARGKPTVTDDLIVMIGGWAAEAGAVSEPGVVIEEPEDLVPLELAGIAARRYAISLLGLSSTEASTLTDDSIAAAISGEQSSMWDAVASAFHAAFDTEIGKAGFAKELLAYVTGSEGEIASSTSIRVLDANYSALIRRLAETLRSARERENDHRRDQRVERIIEEFVEDHPFGCLRDRASIMLSRIDAAADDTTAGDTIRTGTAALRRDYSLGTDPLDRVQEYERFLERLQGIPLLVRLHNQGRVGVEHSGAPTGEQEAGSDLTLTVPAVVEQEPPTPGSTARP